MCAKQRCVMTELSNTVVCSDRTHSAVLAQSILHNAVQGEGMTNDDTNRAKWLIRKASSIIGMGLHLVEVITKLLIKKYDPNEWAAHCKGDAAWGVSSLWATDSFSSFYLSLSLSPSLCLSLAESFIAWSFFSSLKRFSVFDWIQIIVAVAGVLRHAMEPSHNTGQNPFQIWGQYHHKIALCIVFL